MSFKNKLGRTVSYTVLLAGVLTAGNALASVVNVSEGNVNAEGNIVANSTETSIKIIRGESSEDMGKNAYVFGEGTSFTASGVSGEDGSVRNGIDSREDSGWYAGGVTFDKGVGNVNITDGAGINVGKVTINDGTFNVSGTAESLSWEKGDWGKGSLISGMGGIEINGGTVNLGDYAQMVTATSEGYGNFDFNNGTINLNGSEGKEAMIRTAATPLNIGGTKDGTAVLNVAEGKNGIIASSAAEVKENGLVNVNGTLTVMTDRGEAEKEFGTENLASLKVNGGQVQNAGILNVKDIAVNKGNYISNSGTLNGDLALNGTDATQDLIKKKDIDAALAAAPKANFNGNNTVDGSITNTYGVINVADGASLTATDGITNSEMGFIDVAGRIESAVTNTNGQVSVKGSNAYIEQLNGGELNISASTSSKNLFGQEEASSVNEAYISAGNEFTLDNEKFSADNYVTYGKLALAQDVENVTKTKVGRGGALDLGSNTLESATTTMWNGSTLSFNVDQTTDGERTQEGGKLDGDLAVILKDGESATINPTIALGVEDGTYTYANNFATEDNTADDDPDTGVADPQLNISQNNMLYNVDFSEGKKNILEIEKKGADEVAQGVASAGGDANHAGLINAWVGGNANASALSGEARAMAEHLNTLAQTNPKAAVDAAKALAPEVNPVVDSHVTENARQIFNVAGSRLDSATRGMASGDSMFKKAGMWIQGLLNKTEYDKHDGFDVDSEGIAAGIDGYVTDNVKVGVGYAYTESDIDSIGRKTDADTNTGFIYGEYNAPSYYVNGVASYSKGDYKEKKNVAGKLARASYDVDAIAMQAIAGYKMGNFAPEAGLRYINAQQDAYTDTAGQHVGSNSSDTLTAILGGRYATNIQAGEYTLRPEVKLAATYDLMRDKNSTAVTLANGSGYLVRGENLDRFGIEAGVGLSMAVSDNVKVGLNYEGRFKEDYTDHTGILEARYNF